MERERGYEGEVAVGGTDGVTLPLLLTANDLRQLLHPYLIRPSSWRVICVSVAPQWGHGTASGGNSQLIMWLADLRFSVLGC